MPRELTRTMLASHALPETGHVSPMTIALLLSAQQEEVGGPFLIDNLPLGTVLSTTPATLAGASLMFTSV
jgi:hypothetical protein